MVPRVLVCMGEVIPIREDVESTPGDLTDVIGQAYRKAISQLTSRFLSIPRQEACTILINGIIDGARRGIVDVDQLCYEASALLPESTPGVHKHQP
jgi:hypothetical protein